MRTYLAGPIADCTDEEMHDWRDEAAARLSVLDPTIRDYRGRELENVQAVVEGDKDDIDQCEYMLAYCPKPSVGTSMEILYAWQRGQRVVVVVPPGSPISPWLVYHSHLLVDSLDRAIDWIMKEKK
jgi:hypothetical protein